MCYKYTYYILFINCDTIDTLTTLSLHEIYHNIYGSVCKLTILNSTCITSVRIKHFLSATTYGSIF